MQSFINEEQELTKENMLDIADRFFNQTIIVSNTVEYRIREIEFYLRSDDHQDEYTHCNQDQTEYGKWYFHKFKNGTYKVGTFKGLDLTLGS